MSDAPSRLKLFEAVNGRRSTKDIANFLGRHENNVRRDLTLLQDAGLIQPRDADGRAVVFEKVPLARTIPVKYFQPVSKVPAVEKPAEKARVTSSSRRVGRVLSVPTETEVLTIANQGEDQLHEFKAPGVEVNKLTREIAAMLNTSGGGMILYGIDDEGTIVGSDVTKQGLDQPLQNSLRNITPAATVALHGVRVAGSLVLVIIVPPWNRRDVYQLQERVLLRRGTNVFAARTDELRDLHRGQLVI